MVTMAYQQMVECLLDGDGDPKLISFFHSKVDQTSQAGIPMEFVKQHSTFRCLITTIAFGMGMQVPDITYIIHWGPSSSLLDYWQEVGRCARSIKQGWAKMYTPPFSVSSKLCDDNIKELISQPDNGCLRRRVLQHLKVDAIPDHEIEHCCGGDKCCTNCD